MKISRPTPKRSGSHTLHPNTTDKLGALDKPEPLADNPFIRPISPDQPISDIVEIAGIPSHELTPKVQQALTGLLREVEKLRSQMTLLQNRLSIAEERADLDPLLNISNRRSFIHNLERTLSLVKRYDHSATLVFIDLNKLKTINDTYGHAAGDEALRHFSSIISKNIRLNDHFARLGGDEFGLILDRADKSIAQQKLAQLTQILGDEPLSWQGQSLNLRFASGLVTMTVDTNAEEALKRADEAMYANKLLARMGSQ